MTRSVCGAVAAACLVFMGVLPIHAQRPPRPPHMLDTLEVRVGSRASADLPVAIRAVEVLTAEDIARRPVRTVPELLARALGVDVSARSPAQADVAIRGGTFEQVLVLVDGVRVSDAQTGHFDLDLAVPLGDVERVEVLRGPASAVYGADALGGVVNIVTRRRGATRASAVVEGGSFGTLSAAGGAGATVDGLGIGGSAEYRRSDGHRNGTDYRIAIGHVGLEWPLGERPVRVSLGLADREFGAAKFYTSPASDFDEFEATRVVTFQLAWDAPRAARWAVEPRVSIRGHDDDFVLRRDDPGFYRNVHFTWQAGGELTARYAGESARLAVGAEAYRDALESTNLGVRNETRGAVFGEVGVGRVGVALGSAGVRADWHSAYGSFVAPSAGGAVWLTDALHARASVSRAFRAPTWTERYYGDPANIGNPALAPERAWEGELGLELRTSVVQASVSGYARRTHSLIDWARPAGGDPSVPWQTLNVEEATFRGLELAVRTEGLAGARWTARASAISFDADERGDYESKYALRPLVRQASLEMDRAIVGGVDLFLGASYVRRAHENGYLLVDARVGRRFGPATFFADLTNVGETDHLDSAGMPAPGRAVHFGLQWRSEP